MSEEREKQTPDRLSNEEPYPRTMAEVLRKQAQVNVLRPASRKTLDSSLADRRVS
ncbi:MAG: hypothetical protein OXH53_04190 [bacterium]|nr:hypothetical protein [bacterium]